MHPPVRRLSLIAAAVACCFLPDMAAANPTGPTVVNGNASFNQQGKLLTVTNSPGSIINWQGFSIAAGETTRFVQQSSASSVLNRVVGGDASAILGALQSNGRVWLVNPNGIWIGNGAQIDTAGFLASTLNIMNTDFLLGRMRFVDTPGAKGISNAGEIRTPAGGRVVLISPQGVENSGIIHSPQGEVILAAGKTIEIADSMNPEVRIEIAAPEARAVNLGKIVAESGKVGIYGGIVVNRGLVSADSAVVGENGKIVLRATRDVNLEAGSVTTASGAKGGSIEVQSDGTTLVAGTLRATGSADSGGQVSVLGQNVGLIDQASVDVSGARGGGAALIGGDLRGENPAFRNAQMTYVGPDANIKADATSTGDGGKVIVWADDTTRAHGSISARGGTLGGNGGFVETSGKLNLSVTRGPDVRAPAGKGGTWLIDPNNIEIVAGQFFDPTTNTGAPFFAPLANGSIIGVDLINAQLDFGSNVTINTTSRSTSVGTDPGNITLSAPIVKSAATVVDGPFIGTTTLRFEAHNDIIVNPTGSITSTGDRLNVQLIANADNVGGGALTLGGPITTNGGSVQLSGRDLVAVNAPIHALNANGIGGGSVTVSSTASQANIAAAITAGSNVVVQGQTGVNITAPVLGSFFTGSSTAGPVVIGSNITTNFGMNVNAFGFTVTSGVAINTGSGSFTVTNTSPNPTHIQAGASIASFGATVTADNMQFDGTLNAGGGGVTLRQNTFGRAFFLGAEAAGGVAVTSAELANVVTTGPLSIGNGNTGAITVNGPLTFSGPSQVFITSGSTYTQTASSTITSSAPLNISAPGGITLLAPSSAPRFIFTGDSIAVNQPQTSSSDIDVRTSSFNRSIDLGVSSFTGAALEMSSPQMDNLVTAPTGVLRIGTTSSGPITIKGPIAPAGTQSVRLSSGSSISQLAGATITESNLALQAFGAVTLPEANVVGTLAASLCCSGTPFTFSNAAGAPLTIGTVDFISGLRNFNSDTTNLAMIQADNLTIAAPVQFFGGTVALKPAAATTKVDLGGADAAGVLGIAQTDASNVFAANLLVKADQVDISQPIAPSTSALQIEPITTGRALNIVNAAKNPANLELTPTEIGNVSVGTLQLGESVVTGPINVTTPFNVPNTIGTLVLQSSDTTAGITMGGNLTAEGNVRIVADKLLLPGIVKSNFGNVEVSTTGRSVDLGDPLTPNPAKLLLTEGDVENQLQAPLGKVILGSATTGSVDINKPLDIVRANAGGVEIRSGGTLTVAPAGTIGSLTSDGDITLIANDMAINALVTTTGLGSQTSLGHITAMPNSSRFVRLGSDTAGSLALTDIEVDFLLPFPDGTRVLRIGDSTNTTGISIDGPLSLAAPVLSLNAGTGQITQVPNATITVSSLAARANSSIILDQNNDTDTVAAQSNFGNISITYSGLNPLNIGSVDGLAGVQAFGGNITLRSDALNITQRVDAAFGSGNVTITALNPNQPFTIGTKVGLPGLLESELNLIGAFTLFLGNTSTGNFTVTAPVNITGGVSNLAITTAPTATVDVSNALTVPGDITINTGTLSTTAPLTSSFGAITATADAMTFGAMTTSGGGFIALQPQTSGTLIHVGGADLISPMTLGLDGTDLANLSYGGGTLLIGSTTAGDMSVTFAGALPGSVGLLTGGQATFSSNFSVGSGLNITANKMSIPGAASITAVDDISITSATAGRSFTLGTAPGVAANFELAAADFAKIFITGAGTLRFDTSGTLTTTAPLPLTTVPNIELGAGTVVHTGGDLSVPGDITIRANSMPSAGFSRLVSTNGGRITFTPYNSFRSVNVGTNPAGSALGIAGSQLAQVSTSGVVQIGDPFFTSAVLFSAPIALSAGSSALAVISTGSITQAAGASITAPSLSLQAGGFVNLPEANSVGTLAGSSGGNFSFTTAGTLTIGTVDALSGINDSNITVLSDGINILAPVNGFTTTFAPRLANATLSLGSGASGYVMTDASLDMISSFQLNIGNNTTGPISVNSAVDRASGNLALMTAPGSSITVGAPLGSSSTEAITMNTGLGGTVAINGPVQALFGITATGRTITTNAPISSEFSNVTLQAAAGDTGSSITVNQSISAGNNITLTADTQSVNAPLIAENTVILQPRTSGTAITVGGSTAGTLSIPTSTLNLITADSVTIGNSTSGNLTVTSAIGPFTYDSLSLNSGGNVTQTPGSTITVSNTSEFGVVSGSLNVNAGGRIILPEANDIAVAVSGRAGGTGNNFEFNNVTPLKLQNLESFLFASGKVIVSAPPGDLVLTPPLPVIPVTPPTLLPVAVSSDGSQQAAENAVLNDTLGAAPDAGMPIDKRAEEDAAADAAKQDAQDKKEGRKSCG